MKPNKQKSHLESAYGPLQRKTPEAALKQFLKQQFPQYGDLSCDAIVKELVKLIEEFYPSNKHMKMGQVLWYAVDKNETAGYGKSIEKCKLKPVLLNYITDNDIKKLLNGENRKKIKQEIEVRLFNNSMEQGGVLNNIDVATIMNLSPSTISRHIREYEKENDVLIPRRGTIHDMGPSVTHKKQICYKVVVEGKTIEQVARETNHSPEAITRYVKDYKRISSCLANGLSIESTKFVTNVSKKLIYEYMNLIEENNIDITNRNEDNLEIPF